MNLTRLFKYLLYVPWMVHKKFPPATLNKIEAAIGASENEHSAEIRFAVESSLGFFELFQNTSCFEQGVKVFSELKIWDTEDNNGVLIFLLLADRKVEIIADRGYNEKITENEWKQICKKMEASFRKSEFESGVLMGIDAITEKVIQHYPVGDKSSDNELSNKPVVL